MIKEHFFFKSEIILLQELCFKLKTVKQLIQQSIFYNIVYCIHNIIGRYNNYTLLSITVHFKYRSLYPQFVFFSVIFFFKQKNDLIPRKFKIKYLC